MGACGGEALGPIGREIASDGGGLGITPDSGVPLTSSAFGTSDGGISILASKDTDVSGEIFSERILLDPSDERYIVATFPVPLPYVQEPDLRSLNLKIVITTNPSLINPALPCVDGLVNPLNSADPRKLAARAPLYVLRYKLIGHDDSGKLIEHAGEVTFDQLQYLGANCGSVPLEPEKQNPGAAAFELRIPDMFYRDAGTLIAETLELTFITEEDKLAVGHEAEYETRITAALVSRD